MVLRAILAALFALALTACFGDDDDGDADADSENGPTSTPASDSSPTATATTNPGEYAVQPGDTLSQIAVQFGVTTTALQQANNITDPNSIQVGQTLIIPTPGAATATSTAAATATTGATTGGSCDPSYPSVCIPPPPPTLTCNDIEFNNFTVVGADPHGFDNDDGDGIGCEGA
jgi:LysM domain